MREGRKLKAAVHQKCECQELFPLPQRLFLFCQSTDRGLSHSIYSVITLLCQEYPEGDLLKVAALKGSLFHYQMLFVCVWRNLYVRE